MGLSKSSLQNSKTPPRSMRREPNFGLLDGVARQHVNAISAELPGVEIRIKHKARAPKQRRPCHSGGEFAAMDFEPWQEGGWFHDVRNRVAGSQALRRDHTHKTTM